MTSSSSSHRRRDPCWPQAQLLPQTQSLAGRFWRRSVLGGIYCLWVCGLLAFGGLYLFSIAAVARAVASNGGEPVPRLAVLFGAFIAAYEGYRWLAPPEPWTWLRHSVRHKFCHYPYFRFNTCVFEDELGPKQGDAPPQEPEREAAAEAEGSSLAYNFAPALKADDRAMYAFHPHGILTCGMALNGAHHLRFAETDARWLVAENLFWFPALRDMLTWLEFDTVSKRTFERLMARGQNLGFVPGGFEEATLYARGKHRVYLKKRFGFIKLALQHGYKIYPAYTFGEEQTFRSFPYLLKLRLKLNEFKVPGAAFIGSPLCFFMPRSDVDLITVVGTPLQLPQIRDPTPADITQHHAVYMQKLQELFDRHKRAYATDPDAELEIY